LSAQAKILQCGRRGNCINAGTVVEVNRPKTRDVVIRMTRLLLGHLPTHSIVTERQIHSSPTSFVAAMVAGVFGRYLINADSVQHERQGRIMLITRSGRVMIGTSLFPALSILVYSATRNVSGCRCGSDDVKPGSSFDASGLHCRHERVRTRRLRTEHGLSDVLSLSASKFPSN
jgi:hypothetical protein